jgi:hypothetical protein
MDGMKKRVFKFDTQVMVRLKNHFFLNKNFFITRFITMINFQIQTIKYFINLFVSFMAEIINLIKIQKSQPEKDDIDLEQRNLD